MRDGAAPGSQIVEGENSTLLNRGGGGIGLAAAAGAVAMLTQKAMMDAAVCQHD